MRKFLFISLIILVVSCKKNNSDNYITATSSVDTAFLFTNHTWVLYQYGDDNNSNGLIDSEEIIANPYLDNVRFNSDQSYSDSVFFTPVIQRGLWHYSGAGKSVFSLVRDTANNPTQQEILSIHSITDSTLVTIDSETGPHYQWNFYRR